MKKMLLNKKNLYIKLTAVLILLIVGILGIYTAVVQKIATGQCFSILDDSMREWKWSLQDWPWERGYN